MSYAIIGFGNIGQALAKAFARNGIEVSVATTRDPERFASAAAAIGPTIIPEKLAEAVKADIVFLAVRFESHRDVAKALPQRRLVRLRRNLVSPRSNLAGFRKLDCLCRRAEIAGVN
jgi:predicted dinucleotide-binding enzyme